MDKLEDMREELNELIDKLGCSHCNVLAKSQELDKQITLYYKERGQANANR